MSVEDVRAKLPIKTIPNLIFQTSYKAINEMREALYGNASAIPMEGLRIPLIKHDARYFRSSQAPCNGVSG